MNCFCNFLQGGVATQLTQKLLVHIPVVFQRRFHLFTDAAIAGLHQRSLSQILVNPPVDMLVKIAACIAQNSLPQAQATLLYEIQQQNTATCIPAGGFHHTA